MSMNRRRFLELSGTGIALGALSPILGNPFLASRVHAGGLGGNPKKLMIIFLRGGNDGVNTVIPHGDSSYNTTTRPSLFIDPTSSIDLNGFAALHPDMQLMKDVYDAGDLAVLHRIAYDNQSRSHFDSQQLWENALPNTPGGAEVEEGWINRFIDSQPSLANHSIPAVSISNNQQVAFRGDRALVHMRTIEGYQLGNDPIDLKMVGASATGGNPNGSGLLGIYGRTADATDYDETLRDTGIAMASSLDALAVAGVDEDQYVPAGGAFYPDSLSPDGFDNRPLNFFRQVKNGAQLLKETDCRVVGVELTSFDTHSSQLIVNGAHGENLRGLSRAFHSLMLDTQTSIWDDMLVIAVSEFGRTSAENGSQGTDHGEASCVFVAGGGVNGGVYNCDATTWADGDMFSTPSFNPRYVAQTTSFLSIYAEIVDRHFGAPGVLDTVIPGWSGLSGTQYDYLGILPP